ncbi:MAG: response regulator transcription factor [Thermodesulfobacteriota bacterium]|nr:response regulator transcription factor [Thermodesulfobacteriota bacterium]
MNTKLLLVDDHKIMRHGIRSLLEKQAGMEVLEETNNGRTAIELARTLSPDVIIMDIAMHDLNGIEATRQITAELPEVKVIMLSMHSDRQMVADALQAGASGYLLKDCEFDELVRAIETVVSKRTYLSPEIADILVENFVRKSPPEESSASSVLTSREREVLQLLAEGKTTREIANTLCLSTKTVETHRRQMMEKLNIYNVANLIKFAIRKGLTSLEA